MWNRTTEEGWRGAEKELSNWNSILTENSKTKDNESQILRAGWKKLHITRGKLHAGVRLESEEININLGLFTHIHTDNRKTATHLCLRVGVNTYMSWLYLLKGPTSHNT